MEDLQDELSYADDIPYEAQLSESQHEGVAGLKKRIGNRIYLLEDSMSKKRKLLDVDDTTDALEEEGVVENADLPYRPNALLLQGPPITQIPTAHVFAYATHFDAHPIGLEWVDDQTCVLVFSSRKGALHGWSALRKKLQPVNIDPEDPVAIEVDDAFYPAHPLPLTLYPIEERINTVLGNKKSIALKKAMQIRWARSTDVKERGARVKSEFYKRHGDTAGKEGLPTLSSRDESRNLHKRHKKDDEYTRRQLDAELDIFLVEEEEKTCSIDTRLAGRPEERSRNQDEKRRILDYELDSFLAGEDIILQPAEPDLAGNATRREPSLLERTEQKSTSGWQSPRAHDRPTKSLPRRDRRSGQNNTATRYETDSDGRWLHNAEIVQRRRKDTDEDGGFGMRAWSRDREQSRRPKLRKTQEELDQELDQLWQQKD